MRENEEIEEADASRDAQAFVFPSSPCRRCRAVASKGRAKTRASDVSQPRFGYDGPAEQGIYRGLMKSGSSLVGLLTRLETGYASMPLSG